MTGWTELCVGNIGSLISRERCYVLPEQSICTTPNRLDFGESNNRTTSTAKLGGSASFKTSYEDFHRIQDLAGLHITG